MCHSTRRLSHVDAELLSSSQLQSSSFSSVHDSTASFDSKTRLDIVTCELDRSTLVHGLRTLNAQAPALIGQQIAVDELQIRRIIAVLCRCQLIKLNTDANGLFLLP